MNITLDDLSKQIWYETKRKTPKNVLKEIKIFVIMFVISFVWMLLFTNAELFFNIWNQNDSQVINWDENTIQQDNSIATIVEESYDKKVEIEKLIEKSDMEFEKSTTISIEDQLKENMLAYNFDFNVLPPTNRIVIKKINLDVPLVDSKYKDEVDFTQWNFNEELENWVVKYPTTPTPWQAWNTLIFGHTSQEWWQKNPYWTVFSKIPNLENWDVISVVWNWKLYEYKVVEKIIVTPGKVNEQYQKYQTQWKDFITLMWCYPLWRTDKRMMITAERIK